MHPSLKHRIEKEAKEMASAKLKEIKQYLEAVPDHPFTGASVVITDVEIHNSFCRGYQHAHKLFMAYLAKIETEL